MFSLLIGGISMGLLLLLILLQHIILLLRFSLHQDRELTLGQLSNEVCIAFCGGLFANVLILPPPPEPLPDGVLLLENVGSHNPDDIVTPVAGIDQEMPDIALGILNGVGEVLLQGPLPGFRVRCAPGFALARAAVVHGAVHHRVDQQLRDFVLEHDVLVAMDRLVVLDRHLCLALKVPSTVRSAGSPFRLAVAGWPRSTAPDSAAPPRSGPAASSTPCCPTSNAFPVGIPRFSP